MEVLVVDERRRLLERVYSRAGAADEPEWHTDPVTGETVLMTPGQWALAEYDRAHPPAAESPITDAEHPDPFGRRPDATSDAAHDRPRTSLVSAMPGESGATGRRRFPPVLTVIGALVLGSGLTLGVLLATTSVPPRNAADGTPHASASAGGASATGAGDGDEGDTLSSVIRFFASAPAVDDLSPDVTRGFDATSFRLVAGAENTRESSSIYAARRLDDGYCLVAVTGAGRAAEVCGTLDDIARKGIWLTKDALRSDDGRRLTVTVTWATDGTISWAVMPATG